MRIPIAALAAVIGTTSVTAASTSPTPVLVELFTSEGCSSCPPADELLRRLDRTQPLPGVRLVVLSEHVDYWNNLGWRDPYSSSFFTQRQYAYANRIDRSAGAYTPQVVVDGRYAGVGSDSDEVMNLLRRAANDQKEQMTTSASFEQGIISVHIETPAISRPAKLFVAVADDLATSHVRGGENAGRTLVNVAPVRDLVPVADIAPGPGVERTFSIRPAGVQKDQRSRVVTFLQDLKTDDIISVASTEVTI